MIEKVNSFYVGMQDTIDKLVSNINEEVGDINSDIDEIKADFVSTKAQSFTDAQKAQVKENLGLESGGVDPFIIDSDGKKLSEIGDISVGWGELLNNTTIFNDTIIAEGEVGSLYTTTISLSQNPTFGNYVKVTYDGKEYDCLVRNERGIGLCFGASGNPFDAVDFSVFPFFVAVQENLIGFETGGDKGVIKIELNNYNYHKIPNRYLGNVIKVRVYPDNSVLSEYGCDWNDQELKNTILQARANGDNTMFLCEYIVSDSSTRTFYLPLIELSPYGVPIFGGATFKDQSPDDYTLTVTYIAIYCDPQGQSYASIKQYSFDPFNPPSD